MSASIFKFSAGGWSNEIKKVECISETDKTVLIRTPRFTIKGEFMDIRHKKINSDTCYFDTWCQAKEFLILRAESKVTSARLSLGLANSQLGNIKGMKPPKDAP